ncbi:phage N-6-adenine-methyltransferase [Myxococcota bacterium]|nr:phage N-6-adenine-methyltransferase [Myxococcota bacterium]
MTEALTPRKPSADERRALALLERLRELAPRDWPRHAEDLRRLERLCKRLGLTAAEAQAGMLAELAERQRGRRVTAAGAFCVACGVWLHGWGRVPSKARRAGRARTRLAYHHAQRFCSRRCRLAAFRGEWTSPIEAEARRAKLALTDLWRSPPELVARLIDELGPLVLDAAATAADSLAPAWISPEHNALLAPWADFIPDDAPPDGWIWCNPPYGVGGGGLLAWILRAAEQAQATGRRVVVLAPPGIGTQYRREAEARADELRDLADGRLAFLHPETGKPVPGARDGSTLYLFSPRGGPARVFGWSWR